MSRREVIFTCPKCSNHKIDEIMVDTAVISEVVDLGVEDGVADILYGEQTNEEGHVDRYACGTCAYTIVSDAPEFEEFTEDGLGEDALVKAIDKLNGEKGISSGVLVDMDELCRRLAANFSSMPGKIAANTWNDLFVEQVTYEGDSMFKFKVGL